MPRYDYRCPVCGTQIEIERPMQFSDDPVVCECRMAEMQRVFTMPNVNWNGLPPWKGEISPDVKRMVEEAPRRRDNETPHKSSRLAEINRRLQHG